MSEVDRLLFDKTFRESDLHLIVKQMSEIIPRGSIVLLSGDLAAGKTTWIAEFCRAQGLEYIQSPTYAIHQRYANANVCVDHFDLYRLQSEDELQAAGFYDLLNEAADFKMIEWPERMDLRDLPMNKPAYALKLQSLSSGERRICLKLIVR